MPKKDMTPEERKAWGEKMKAARAAKKEAEPTPSTSIPQQTPDDLLRQIKELAQEVAELRSQRAEKGSPTLSNTGSLVGRFEKYILDPARYPDPTERLAHETRLQRFAFNDNYELKYFIKTTNYTSIDGVHTSEPRFELELYGIMFDDDGEPTNKRYVIKKMIMHEDPEEAMWVARQNELGHLIDEMGEADFLNEMRYLRARDWLLNVFYPSKEIVDDKRNRSELVIDNKLVEVFELASTDKAGFDKIAKK